MNRVLLISYDLKETNKDYSSIYDVIKRCSLHWWHYLDSMWLVVPRAGYDIDDYKIRIKHRLGKLDRFIVIDITNVDDVKGWLPLKAWLWIRKNTNCDSDL